ncbi:LOW QUALITY PROTEIN: hypothetical protein Cgig2_021342 [Carnegiea gigantea]|uniref:Aminotransferase-like plant mobile domain-containing protein n=1 Tax=Carnegiea gigantea TaxID=171969 RepID=A0A9Q1JHJ1_9CARY|nr:LOW QUALITY PROTEIN: hypothetical protein Cgig2_021342 [Carnegiea gigantea]
MIHSLDDMQRRLCNPGSHIEFNGFCLLLHVWFYEHTIRFDKLTFLCIARWLEVNHGGRYDVFELVAGINENQITLILHPRDEEIEEPIVREFMETVKFRYYVEHGEVVLTFEERLRWVRDSLRKEKEAYKSTRAELELFMTFCFEDDSVSLHGQRSSLVDYIPLMGGKNMNTTHGSPRDKDDDSGAKNDVDKKAGVRTKVDTSSQAEDDEIPHMNSNASACAKVMSSLQVDETVKREHIDVVHTSGVHDTAPVGEEETSTAFIINKLPKAVSTLQ